MSAPAKVTSLLRLTVVVRLAIVAVLLALLGGLLCGTYLLSALQLGPDQVGHLAVAILIMALIITPLLLIIVICYVLPLYRALQPIEGAELVSTEQALGLWTRLHRFPRHAMLMSVLMWIGWTAFIGWWMVHRRVISSADAFLTIPTCALLGVTNAIGFYFRARALFRPILLRVGGHLPPDFEPPTVVTIKSKLAMGFLYMGLAVGLSLGTEILLWHQRGADEMALGMAREISGRVAREVAEGKDPDCSPVRAGGVTYRPFILSGDGNPEKGSLLPVELELIHHSPRLMGRKEWGERRWMEAAVADFVLRAIPMPTHDRIHVRGLGKSDLVFLAPQPMRGGHRRGAVIEWTGEAEAGEGTLRELAPVAVIVLFFGAAMLVTVLWTYWVAGDVIEPVRNLRQVITEGMGSSAPGRTNMISDDEIGQLGAAFNRMSIALSREMNESRRLLDAVRGAAGKIGEIMRSIVDVSSDQAAGATEQAASLHQVTTTSEEIAVTLRSIAEHSRSVEEVAGRSLSSCFDGQTHLGNVNAGMESAQQRSRDVADKMIQFQEHANRIENILEFIREVSERINLISLNASIEASSAGDSGSRFAIIASEMRKLAEKTMSGTKEIRNIFSDLQSSASSAIIATEEGEKQVIAARKLVDQASSSFQSIIHWAGETARAAQEISLSSSQQTTATDHLASALAEINDVASNFAEGAKSLENSVNDLEKIGEELQVLLSGQTRTGETR